MKKLGNVLAASTVLFHFFISFGKILCDLWHIVNLHVSLIISVYLPYLITYLEQHFQTDSDYRTTGYIVEYKHMIYNQNQGYGRCISRGITVIKLCVASSGSKPYPLYPCWNKLLYSWNRNKV